MGWKQVDEFARLRQISKIVFVSQDNSAEIVQGDLRIGASGYLLKSDATELPLVIPEKRSLDNWAKIYYRTIVRFVINRTSDRSVRGKPSMTARDADRAKKR